jgi:protocatechuate 3,4-dioxygenase, alpha subunit
VLSRIEQEGRRATLVAEAAGPGRYRFVIRLQGDGETVFLDI